MSDEELALALTEIAAKCQILPIHSEELPYDSNGLNVKYCDEHADILVSFYRSALKAISKK